MPRKLKSHITAPQHEETNLSAASVAATNIDGNFVAVTISTTPTKPLFDEHVDPADAPAYIDLAKKKKRSIAAVTGDDTNTIVDAAGVTAPSPKITRSAMKTPFANETTKSVKSYGTIPENIPPPETNNTNHVEKVSTLPDPNDDTMEEEWVQQYVTPAKLVQVGLRGDVPDSTLLAYSLCIPVVLSRDDRIGKYKIHAANQYVGFACQYCHRAAVPGFGRYFPNSYNSLLNGTNTASLLQHFMTHCRQCPSHVRHLITNLHTKDAATQQQPPLTATVSLSAEATAGTNATTATTVKSSTSKVAMNRPRYGSRKRFYTHIWNTLRSIDPQQIGQEATTEVAAAVAPQPDRHYNNPKESDSTSTIKNPTDDDDNYSHINAMTKSDDEKGKSGSSSTLTKEQEELFYNTVESSDIVQIQDRFLVSDTTLLTMAQLKICALTKEDQIGRCKEHRVGFIGLCCTHCGGKPGKPGYGRYFPSSLRSLAQADACQQIVKHITNKCTVCPLPMKQLLRTLCKNDKQNHSINEPQHDISESHVGHPSESCNVIDVNDTVVAAPAPTLTTAPPLSNDHIESAHNEVTSSKSNQYGSRRIFFRRVWARLHGTISLEVVEHTTMVQMPKVSLHVTSDTRTDDVVHVNGIQANKGTVTTVVEGNGATIPWDRVIGLNNCIVMIDADRGLISDAQLSAMAQMDVCHLTEADKIGWFKDRNIGCVGLCCKHCRGRPSFGRYFPNSLRSLAQTTSSQTIISHVTLYCPQCPKDIRDIILQLHRLENSKDASTTPVASNYGSRKVFFDRVWKRMHSQSQTNMTTATTSLDGGNIAVINEQANIISRSITTPDNTSTTALVADMETGGKLEIALSVKRALDSHVQVDDKSSEQFVTNLKRSKECEN